MRIIFIGQLYTDGQLEYFISHGSNVDIAAHTFQRALLDGMKQHDIKIDVISTPYVSCYPKAKLLHINGGISNKGIIIHSVPFTNIVGIKHLSKFLNIRKKLRQILTNNEDCRIVIYGIHSPFLLSLLGLKRDYKYKTCLIVPDLPEYMSEKKNILYIIAKSLDRIFINYGLKKIDSYALFSSLMTERLDICKPYTVLEGIYKNNDSCTQIPKSKHKVVLYSGNLDTRYGIMTLIDAFTTISDNDFRLWICGNGNSVSNILECTKKDPRIKYWGVLPREEVLKMQREATILVNPRRSSEAYTRYSFPSKTMEYLASGTPTIMAHLASIPPEYDPYIHYLEDESVEGLRKKIIEVASMTQEELKSFGLKAREFILTKKNNYNQANKLISLLRGL